MTETDEDTGWKIPLHGAAVLTAVIMVLVMAVSGGACLLFYLNTAASEQIAMEVRQKAALNIAVNRVFDSMQGVISDLKFLGSQHEIQDSLARDSASARAELTYHFLTFSEHPLKPMIRFSQPIYSDDERLLGVLVLNYFGKQVLDRIRDEEDLDDGELMLVNSDGYWILNPNPKLEWGFMLPERGAYRFGRFFSREWRTIAGGVAGQFSTPNGLFAYKAFSPGRRVADFWNCDVKASPQSEKWLFVHRISRQAAHCRLAGLRKNLFILWAVMAFFAVVPAWLLATAFLKRRQTRQQIWRMANFDVLTGLFNRSSFMYELQQAVALGQRYRRNFVLLYLDLDGFKQINDTLGHDAGDRVLQQTAERFRAALRASDCVARLGGDEFCIIVRETGTAGEAAKVAGKLIGVLAAPFDLEGRTGRVGASIGIARFPEDDGTADGLLKLADQAMYAAKAGGKNRFCFFQPEKGPGLVLESTPDNGA